jgi:hypothetical protein
LKFLPESFPCETPKHQLWSVTYKANLRDNVDDRLDMTVLFMYLVILEMRSHCVDQAGLKLLGSSNPPASASWDYCRMPQHLALWLISKCERSDEGS